MKKLFGVLVIVSLAAGIWWQMRPSVFDTGHPLTSDGSAIDLLADLDTNELSPGWAHRTFLTVSPADFQMVQDAETPTLQCITNNSASILARDTQIPVAALPTLSWDWKVIQPIESDIDEATKEGDDHPARLFIVFSNENDERKAMEIIWSNRKYAPGDYKIIGDFYHYVANGLNENIGIWHSETVDLQKIYTDIGGTGTPTLQVLGFFCDSDNTGEQSDALFKNVRLSSVSN